MNTDQPRTVKENLGEHLRRSRQSLDEFRAETQAKARRAVRITNNYAHDHPWRLVATAAAISLAAGLLIRRGASAKSTPSPRPALRKSSRVRSRLDVVHAWMPLALVAWNAWQKRRPPAAHPPNP